jgi:drug/metabolite transporter (DMT)-like permease
VSEEPARRTQIIRVEQSRAGGDTGRTSPRMRLDLLQIAAWAAGLYLVVAGLVAVARTGFEDVGLFRPIVEVGGQAATPLLAVLWLVVGALLLAAGTGEVDERRLRIVGVLFGIVGAVFLIEPGAFTEYLGVDGRSGVWMLVIAVALVLTSFVPPVSIARPGIDPTGPPGGR